MLTDLYITRSESQTVKALRVREQLPAQIIQPAVQVLRREESSERLLKCSLPPRTHGNQLAGMGCRCCLIPKFSTRWGDTRCSASCRVCLFLAEGNMVVLEINASPMLEKVSSYPLSIIFSKIENSIDICVSLSLVMCTVCSYQNGAATL